MSEEGKTVTGELKFISPAYHTAVVAKLTARLSGVESAIRSLESALGRLEAGGAPSYVEIGRASDEIDEAIAYLRGNLVPSSPSVSTVHVGHTAVQIAAPPIQMGPQCPWALEEKTSTGHACCQLREGHEGKHCLVGGFEFDGTERRAFRCPPEQPLCPSEPLKIGDFVRHPSSGRSGVIKRIIEGTEWPKPYAWVEDDSDRWDVELRHLEKVTRSNDAVKAVRCRKCGRVEAPGAPTQKYCGDGSDKDNSHEWESVSVQRPQDPLPKNSTLPTLEDAGRFIAQLYDARQEDGFRRGIRYVSEMFDGWLGQHLPRPGEASADLEEIKAMTDEQVDAELRAAGADPVKIGDMGRAAAYIGKVTRLRWPGEMQHKELEALLAEVRADERSRMNEAEPDYRRWLQHLVNFVRADQCDEDCGCCRDYLNVADHAARETGLPDGIECYRCGGEGSIASSSCRHCGGTGRRSVTVRPRPGKARVDPVDDQRVMSHVAAHERQFINQGWIDDLKALVKDVREDERRRLRSETAQPPLATEYDRLLEENRSFYSQNIELRGAVSQLRLQLSLARYFVEGKAMVPDMTVLLAIDHVLKETKPLETGSGAT